VRVVLDSSVLIAAMARPGTCTELADEVAGDHTLVLSEHIVGEVERKLQEKFGLPAGEAQSLVTDLKERGELVEPAEVPESACRDAEDLPVLGTVVAGSAQLLVRVDKDLLELGSFREIPIIKPGAAFRRLRG
jgi:putative PIN family toxin of toxin-antitoxin system